MKIGVLALQGDFREHLSTLEQIGVDGVAVRLPADLDGVSGLTQASALRPGARAWQVEAGEGRTVEAARGETSRPWLLGLQGVALILVAVLAAPTRRVSR